MPRAALSPILLLLLLTFASSSALAWGARGHRIIATLAELQLTPKAKAGITALLGDEDLATVSTWADDMRSSKDDPAFWSDYASAWHFVNLPVNGSYTQSRKNPKGDAVAAMATFTAILLDQPLPPGPVHTGLRYYFGKGDLHTSEVKRFALKFLIHVVADLHQPLHSGYASDRGGNDIRVMWQGKAANLHAVWDSSLLEHDKRSETVEINRLRNRLEHIPDSDLRSMQSTDVSVWLRESSELLAIIHATLPPSLVLDVGYTAKFAPTVDNQLAKAAVRTAWLLNKVFGSGPAESH